MTQERLKNSLTQHLVYDRSGDYYDDTISAFHKSVRGSDPDAALYDLARMLKSGGNPLFIARRFVVATSEDIGLANDVIQTYATSVYSMLENISIRDAQVALAQLVVTMCLTKKSTRSYRGLNKAFAISEGPRGGSSASTKFEDSIYSRRHALESCESWYYAEEQSSGSSERTEILGINRFLIQERSGS
ncbi:Werner helicase interacting protein 1 [Aspergillus hancockii]|nr:Werner helicase interacting protein 1 [Aspergillus hancockii]